MIFPIWNQWRLIKKNTWICYARGSEVCVFFYFELLNVVSALWPFRALDLIWIQRGQETRPSYRIHPSRLPFPHSQMRYWKQYSPSWSHTKTEVQSRSCAETGTTPSDSPGPMCSSETVTRWLRRSWAGGFQGFEAWPWKESRGFRISTLCQRIGGLIFTTGWLCLLGFTHF